MKENSNLRNELKTLCKYVEKSKAEGIVEFQPSQTYFDELRALYGDNFKDFHKRAIFLFLGVDFSQV